MNERQNRLVSMLANFRDGKMVTSQQLAKRLNVTTRTIKSDMGVVADAFERNGAKLIGKRNKGYTTELTDEKKFTSFILRFNLKESETEGKMNDRGELRIYTARELIASSNGARIDDIADAINYNRSYVSELLKWSTTFFESYRLKMKSSANSGKMVVGKEHNRRLAMVELIATHYHLLSVQDEPEEAFAKWFECSEKDRNNIRHAFLRVIRESGYALSDSNTQRVAMYLIVAYNRFDNGFRVSIPESWINTVKELKIHRVTEQIFSELPERYQILQNDENEACLFTCILLTYLDVRMGKYPNDIVDIIRDDLVRCCQSVEAILSKYGFVLDEFEKQTIENCLVPIIFSTRFEMDGADKFNYKNEAWGLTSPIDLFVAYQISDSLTENIGYHSNRTNLSLFGVLVQSLLYSRQWPIKKQRLLSTGTFGAALAYSFDKQLMKRYPDLIESITEIELYEYRRIENENYDGFLVDMFFVDDRSSTEMNGYNYKLPAVSTLNRMGENLEERIYDLLLVNAYQFKEYIPKEEEIHIIENYRFGSIELLFQSLSLMHAKSFNDAREMWERLGRRENNKAMIFNDVVVVCVEPEYCRDKVLELYCLDATASWKERKFNYIIFSSLQLDNVYKLKALETCIRILVQSDEINFFKKDPQMCCEHIIRTNLRGIKK